MVHLKCIGLTAPHIGILKRIVTINIDNHITELVNPKIIDSLGKQKGKEGSISCLGQTVTIIKTKIIKVKEQNKFKKISKLSVTLVLKFVALFQHSFRIQNNVENQPLNTQLKHSCYSTFLCHQFLL